MDILNIYLDITPEIVDDICFYSCDPNSNGQDELDLIEFDDLPLNKQLPLIRLGYDMACYNYLDYVRARAKERCYDDVNIILDSELYKSQKNMGNDCGDGWCCSSPELSSSLKETICDFVERLCKCAVYIYASSK